MDSNSIRTFVKEEVELRGRPESEISHWWRTLTLLSYMTVVVSGLALSISTGDILAAFENKCILYSKITLLNLDTVPSNKTLQWSNLAQDKNIWSDIYDCNLCEYSGASSVLFAGMLFVMILQSGKGGLTGRSQNNSWEIVPFAIIVNFVFFIISTVVMAKILGGISVFCTYTLTHSQPLPTNLSCENLFEFQYPMDQYRTDLYLAYIISQISAVLMFLGWFSVLAVTLLRFLLGIDFDIYRRQQFATVDKLLLKEQSNVRSSTLNDISQPALHRKRNTKSWKPKPFYEEIDSSSENEGSSDDIFENETSFFLSKVDDKYDNHLKGS